MNAAAAHALHDHLHELSLRGYSDGTRYSRHRAIQRLARALGDVDVLNATDGDLYAWRAALTIAPTSVVSYVSHAKSFYAWCVERGHMETNPADGLPVPRKRRRMPRPISEDDLTEAVTHAPPRIRPWLVLAGWAGLRAQEVARLCREDIIDGADPPVLVVTAHAAKGRQERIVPLHPYVIAELRHYGLPQAGYVFRRYDGQPGPNQPWVISRLAAAYLHEIGFDATLHQLRHRFGTQLYATSGDLRVTQELMGHKDPATTAGYAAYSPRAARTAIGRIRQPAQDVLSRMYG